MPKAESAHGQTRAMRRPPCHASRRSTRKLIDNELIDDERIDDEPSGQAQKNETEKNPDTRDHIRKKVKRVHSQGSTWIVIEEPGKWAMILASISSQI